MKRFTSIVVLAIALISFNGITFASGHDIKGHDGYNPAGRYVNQIGNAWWKNGDDDRGQECDRNRDRNRNRKCKKCDRPESVVNICEETNTILQAEVDALMVTVDDQAADLDSCNAKSGALQIEIESLTSENFNLKNQIKELQAQLESMALEMETARTPEVAMMASLENETIPEEQTWAAQARKFAVYKMAADHPNTPNAYGVYTNFFIPESELHNLISAMDTGVYEVNVQVIGPEGNLINIETVFDAHKEAKAYYDNYVTLTTQQ